VKLALGFGPYERYLVPRKRWHEQQLRCRLYYGWSELGRLTVARVIGGWPDLANQVTNLTRLPDLKLTAKRRQVLRGAAVAHRREHRAEAVVSWFGELHLRNRSPFFG
jgi:hypothetical protein